MIYQTFKDIYDEDLAKDAIINDRMEGFKEDYLVLVCLLKKYNIKSCFEIGCHTGFGSKVIKNAMGDNSILISLDLPDELANVSKQHPLSEGKQGVGFECDLPFLLLRGDSRTFDFSQYPCAAYYCDAEHTADNVANETIKIMKCNPKIIIYHDSNLPEVWKGISYGIMVSNNRWDYDLYRVEDTRVAYLKKRFI